MKCEKCGIEVVTTTEYQSGRFCSRKCANSRNWNQKHKDFLSKKMKGYHFGNTDVNNPNRNIVYNGKPPHLPVDKICPVCNGSFTILYWKRKKKYCSLDCSRKAPGQGGYHPNSTRKIRSKYNGFWMDSGAERRFAELLDKHKIVWIKNSTKYFDYVDKEGKKRKYYPDFYLPKYDYWVEIKGRWYQNVNDDLKLKSVGNIEMQLHNEIRIPKCVEVI